MPNAKDVYINCDELENLPAPNRENYLYEADLLQKELPKNAKVLQIGSMDGMRIVRLLQLRPDLQLTGLEIEDELVKIAEQNTTRANLKANFITGDITNPPNIPRFDYVICLNNTLGYIPNQKKALAKIKKIGKIVVISVYGEKFTDALAKEYFKTLHLEIEQIENNTFIMKDFTKVKRYTKGEVASWKGRIIETPIGYFTILT